LPAINKIINAYEEAAQEVYISPCFLAYYYYFVKNYTKALECLEKGYEVRDGRMAYINARARFDSLYDSTRYITILKKMNLSLPED
jgi:hypothetical protein